MNTPKRWKDRLEQTGTSDEGWTIHYLDPDTDEHWVEYFPYREDKAPSYFRKSKIHEDPEDFLLCCLTSDAKDDWRGAGAHASGAFDTELVADILERIRNQVSHRALKEFGRFFQPYDNRNIIGMNFDEVSQSYERFTLARARIEEITKKQNRVGGEF